MLEEQARRLSDPALREKQIANAAKYREEGELALKGTIEDTQQYVKKHSGHYQEQARADMKSALAHRTEIEGFASTLDDIKNLPESDGPNN